MVLFIFLVKKYVRLMKYKQEENKMKKFVEFVVTALVVFLGIMWSAEQSGAINSLITDIIYWFDLEEYVMPTLIGISCIIAAIAYTIADILTAIAYDVWNAIKFVFTKVFHKETA